MSASRIHHGRREDDSGSDTNKRTAWQSQTIIVGIVIGAALLIGFFLTSALWGAIPATEQVTVTNETVTQDVGNWTAVDAADKEGVKGFLDNEVVYNSSDTELTEGTDYEWNETDGTIKFLSTASTTDGNNANITYTYDYMGDDQVSTVQRISQAMLLGGVVIIVLFAAVVLRVLRNL